MGLDVRTYGNIKLAENEEEADFTAYVIDEDWKHKIKNLQDGKAYTGDVVFRGVSYPYSAHNRFREKLVKLVGREDLLDNEGRIKWGELPSEIPFYVSFLFVACFPFSVGILANILSVILSYFLLIKLLTFASSFFNRV